MFVPQFGQKRLAEEISAWHVAQRITKYRGFA